jgi:hypothetical protein
MGKMFQNASSLKPLGQLKPNCPGMIIGRSSTNFLFFMPVGNVTQLGHIILILSKPVFALTPYFCLLSEKEQIPIL